MTDTSPAPAVGQIWQDNDKRSPGRFLRIDSVDATHASALPVAWNPVTRIAVTLPGARPTRIRLDRFRPTSSGYLYITTEDQ